MARVRSSVLSSSAGCDTTDRLEFAVLLGHVPWPKQVLDNIDFIAKNTLRLRNIQIDHGYPPVMGDSLATGAAFGGNVHRVLKQIRERNFEPAIWVAPFVAEESSHIFQQHPDWLVKDNDAKPKLRPDDVCSLAALALLRPERQTRIHWILPVRS
jgi:pterin-4a-carbinolamine dehydratase